MLYGIILFMVVVIIMIMLYSRKIARMIRNAIHDQNPDCKDLILEELDLDDEILTLDENDIEY